MFFFDIVLMGYLIFEIINFIDLEVDEIYCINYYCIKNCSFKYFYQICVVLNYELNL